jgi:hypothetical protein
MSLQWQIPLLGFSDRRIESVDLVHLYKSRLYFVQVVLVYVEGDNSTAQLDNWNG